MPITGHGWELHVVRLGIHLNGAKKRTYGTYQIYVDGAPQIGLDGFMAESIGPGDNKVAGNRLRIEAGRYPL